MTSRILTAIAAAASLAVASPAIACSVTADYRVPTNLELAADAELILLGRVVGEVEGPAPWNTKLMVEPVQAIKGEMPDGTVSVARSGLVPEERPDFGILSNPYELNQAHPLSYIGACIRYMFPRGTTALFFLERAPDGEGWQPSGGPFSRWAEDVLIDNAPWLRLTRFYTEVAAAPESERAAMFEAERARLAALSGDPVAQLMAADIARQLEGPEEAGAVAEQAPEG